MGFRVDGFILLFLVCGTMLVNGEVVFDDTYRVTWGAEHVVRENGGTQVQIYLDQYHGGAGFESKQYFGSGLFDMKIKVPARDCAGVVLAFYLKTEGANNQDELDIEFLGNRENKPITLQTNVITSGQNYREQRINLWFDPTSDYHDYKILWNHHQVVFSVDDIPIRVFRNNRKIRVNYFTRPLALTASIWDGSSWATDGGQTKIDYNKAPFRAYFRKFDMNACTIDKNMTSLRECYATKYLWNHRVYRHLNSFELERYNWVRRRYMTYDYCNDTNRFQTLPRECSAPLS